MRPLRRARELVLRLRNEGYRYVIASAAKDDGLVGDTPYDARAARDANVAFIGVTSGGWPAEALAGAIAVYKDHSSSPARRSMPGDEHDQEHDHEHE